MSNSPVTLDFSTAQPLAPAQPAKGGGNVSLDFSTAQPIADGGAPTTEAAAASGDYANQQAHNAETAPIEQQHTAGDVPEASPVQKPGSGGEAAMLAGGAEGGAGLAKGVLEAGAKYGTATALAKTGIKGASEVLGKLAAENPVAAKAAKAYGTYLAVHIAHKMGLPLPKILEVIGE